MQYAQVEKEYETKNLGKRTVKFTVPQAESLEELVGENFYKSEAELVDRTNKVIARGAVQGGNTLLKDASEKATTEAEWLEIEKKALEGAKGYHPEISTGISAKTAKQGVDNLMDFRTKNAEIFKKFSPDEVVAFLTESKLPDWAIAEINKAA